MILNLIQKNQLYIWNFKLDYFKINKIKIYIYYIYFDIN